ncbi:hypothetical protein NIGALANA_31 [Bacillus phage Nigalana]|uniref:hypothetical protein n=1 Tax=Bacillus phage Nigalana TaxID=1805951 RepID=UPI0007A76D86|nr:hypothetical protein BI005_gp031 [Bacillus phage Nigalana]YP_009286906.1 hypothetical protein BI006_gp030 [Bacillus phage Nemo]ASR78642.1 hypothetical protein BUBS_30 [Bacillus phage Bubs]AXQ67582.1 hypothetical protein OMNIODEOPRIMUS_30 [Bacillus phage OmnioDeoPrimus]AMW61185.1 hypothetical protein NIGALANA_31 [Bacillus phage Nigalana]AMW63656.1 hypothetical protein NEMO_30 [Bacillus phage Nemo]
MIGPRKMYPCEHNGDFNCGGEFLIVGVTKKGKLSLVHVDKEKDTHVKVNIKVKEIHKIITGLRDVIEGDWKAFQYEKEKEYLNIERADCTDDRQHIIILLEGEDADMGTAHLSQRNAEDLLKTIEKILRDGRLYP